MSWGERRLADEHEDMANGLSNRIVVGQQAIRMWNEGTRGRVNPKREIVALAEQLQGMVDLIQFTYGYGFAEVSLALETRDILKGLK